MEDKRDGMLPIDVEERLIDCGFPSDGEDYVTYLEAWAWIWDNTDLKLYPKESVDGTVSMCRVRETDMEEEVMAFGYDTLSDAIEDVVRYVVTMGMVETSIRLKRHREEKESK